MEDSTGRCCLKIGREGTRIMGIKMEYHGMCDNLFNKTKMVNLHIYTHISINIHYLRAENGHHFSPCSHILQGIRG